jgi:3',5'-cyclic AMP phosphodiesterase CpdA
MPDTQQEVLSSSDPRFADRTEWLVDERRSLNLAYVTHVGDIVNWDTPDHAQYKIAAAGLKKLNDAGIPYSVVPGNHDTAAVCPGGSACDPPKSPQLIRDTSSYNAYLDQGTADLRGRFEAYKVDNTYSTFSAGQRNWLVLNLEIYPRVAVVNWAKNVVASHPTYNVIVVTHSYLTSGGAIGTRQEYGSTNPAYLYKNLISQYANIRLVFSGHVGTNAHRVDTGVHKNRIDSFLLCMHDRTYSPVRLVTIDTWSGTLKTWVYSPYKNHSYPGYTMSLSRLSYVR